MLTWFLAPLALGHEALDRAEAALWHGDWAAAEAAATEVPTSDPDWRIAQLVLMRAHRNQDELQEAVNVGRQLQQAAPDAPEAAAAMLERARIYASIERWDVAVTYAEDASTSRSDLAIDGSLEESRLHFVTGDQPRQLVGVAHLLGSPGYQGRWFEPGLDVWAADAWRSLCRHEEADAAWSLATVRLEAAEAALATAAGLSDQALVGGPTRPGPTPAFTRPSPVTRSPRAPSSTRIGRRARSEPGSSRPVSGWRRPGSPSTRSPEERRRTSACPCRRPAAGSAPCANRSTSGEGSRRGVIGG